MSHWSTQTSVPTEWSVRLSRLRHSVRGKLMGVVFLTTTIALLIAGAAMLSHDVTVYRSSWTSDLSTQAHILALSTAPALLFDDRETAARDLAALQARPQVLVAAIYGRQGALYARYVRPGSPAPPPRMTRPAFGPRISGEQIQLVQPILRNGETLGTIYLLARYDLHNRIMAYCEIFALVILLGLLTALLLSTLLQRVVTRPLEAIAEVARQVISREDYSPRATLSKDPQIGIVLEAFNRMLEEVQQRTNALQSEVRARQDAEQSLARANARLESTLAAAEIGSWTWDLHTQMVTGDRNLAALYGLPQQSFSIPFQVLRTQIHPQERELIANAEQEALRTGILRSTEFRVIAADGRTRWVAARGKVLFDTGGKPQLLAGLLIDLTAQKAAEEALRRSEKLYRAIGESIQYGVWVCDARGEPQYVSESFLHLTGVGFDAWKQDGWRKCLHPEDAAATVASWQESLQSGLAWYSEYRIRGADGRYYAILSHGVPIRDEQQQLTGWAGLNLDIGRLKHTEEALREADRRKDEFLATLAHELRNPLAPIRHAVGILEFPEIDERQRQWGRDVIARQVQRMALLLDDLLDVSRITRGRLEIKKLNVDLSTVISAAVETARPLVETKGHQLEILMPPQPVQLNVDPLRLSQSISNLLTNAAKYTDAKGRITLSVVIDEQGLTLTVTDTGIGLSPEAIPKLFQMFSQVDSPVDRAEGGLGIGLALVKGLIELHGGSVSVTSAGVGHGSRFSIRLPTACLVQHPATAASGATDKTPTKGSGLRILLADDNRDAVDTLALLLEMTGYEVHSTHSAAAVLDLGPRLQPQVYVLDIGMPELNGYELARQIRREPWGRYALLIALTGWGQQEDRECSRAAGFDHHLTKPVDPDELTEILHRHAERSSSDSAPVAHTEPPKVSTTP